MSSRRRYHAVTIGLLVLAAGLALFVLVLDRGSVTTGEAEARKRNVFPAFRRPEITAIEIRRPSGAIRLVHRRGEGEGDDYLLALGPANTMEAADSAAVGRLISVLETASPERSVDPGQDPSALGLSAPRVEVTVEMGPVHYRLILGRSPPAPAGAAYAMLEAGRPFVARAELVSELERPEDEFRSKFLSPYLASTLSSLDLAVGGEVRHLERRKEGRLRVATPHGVVRVERAAEARLLSALADLRAESFLTREDGEGALGERGARLVLTFVPSDPSRSPAKIEIGAACPGAPGRRAAVRRAPEPVVYACIPDRVYEPLAEPAERLADDHLFSLFPDEVVEIALEMPGRRLEIARSGTAWHMRAPTDSTVDAETGGALAQSLCERTAEFAPSPPPAFIPKGRVALLGPGVDAPLDAGAPPGLLTEGRNEQVVEVGEPGAGGRTLVRRAEDGALFELDSSAAATLIPSPLSVRGRSVVDAPVSRVRRIRIEYGSVHQTLRRSPEGEWKLEEPRGLGPDASLAGEAAEAVAGLRAERWVAEQDDGTYGLDPPRGHVELELDKSERSGIEPARTDLEGRGEGSVERIRVTLGAVTQGGAFAHREGDAAVFVVPRATLRTLETWAIDRSYLSLDPAGAREVRVRRGREELKLSSPRRGSEVGPMAEKLARLKDALGDLRAEAALHPGPAQRSERMDKPQLELWVDRKDGAGRSAVIHVLVGAGDVYRGMSVYYVRRADVDATFVVAQSRVAPLFDLLTP